MTPINGCELARRITTEVNTTIAIIIMITAANDIGNNPLNLEVYFKPLKMSKFIDIVKKNIPSA